MFCQFWQVGSPASLILIKIPNKYQPILLS